MNFSNQIIYSFYYLFRTNLFKDTYLLYNIVSISMKNLRKKLLYLEEIWKIIFSIFNYLYCMNIFYASL